MKLRAANPADVPVILRFIHDLAAFEREPDAVQMTEAQLLDALFGPKPRAEALLAEHDGAPQGVALWSESFNTWTGRPGLAIEDVYVTPEARGAGIGRTIFTHLARLAVERGCARMEWSVLDWNEQAIEFYQKLGAAAQSHWHKYRLSGNALYALANEEQAHG